MATMTYGGNRVSSVPLHDGVTTLANDAYVYRVVVLNGDAVELLPSHGSWTVFVLKLDPATVLKVGDLVLGACDTLQVEHHAVSLTASGDGSATVLVAGVPSTQDRVPSVERHAAVTHYKVTKPWGHELWLNGEHPNYCLKEVFLRAGSRTSLQYHREKRETNFLTRGQARLVYRESLLPVADVVSSRDLHAVDLEPMSTVDVTPFVLHRIEAVTDVYLYEASTPHLDDVVRVQDDASRGDGRILAEHRM